MGVFADFFLLGVNLEVHQAEGFLLLLPTDPFVAGEFGVDAAMGVVDHGQDRIDLGPLEGQLAGFGGLMG